MAGTKLRVDILFQRDSSDDTSRAVAKIAEPILCTVAALLVPLMRKTQQQSAGRARPIGNGWLPNLPRNGSQEIVVTALARMTGGAEIPKYDSAI